jgi:hypothetical protein
VKYTAVLPVALSLAVLCMAQNTRSVPPGLRHAQELEAQNERPSEPISLRVDAASLRREADELASLAASVPPGVQNLSKGLLEKDLVQKLKQIEKLSKHLRGELAR